MVCLGPPEPTDPRDRLDPQVVLEPRDPPVCRVCLEREGLAASLDPRETEVTTERRDPRVLLAKMDPGV